MWFKLTMPGGRNGGGCDGKLETVQGQSVQIQNCFPLPLFYALILVFLG